MSILERVVRLEAWREQVDERYRETVEKNTWLVRGFVVALLGTIIAVAKVRGQ